MRARRSLHLLELLEQTHRRNGCVRVIDIGGTRNYWNALPDSAIERFDVHVTVVNLPDVSRPVDEDRFRFVAGDGCDLADIEDRTFDIAHANSVLEHVGDWRQMRRFAGEVRRVADSYVVQTPYFWFPVEPHLMAPLYHWLPESIRIRVLMRYDLGHAGRADTLDDAVERVQGAHLVDIAMFRALFPDGVLHIERFLGLPKSLMAVRQHA